MDRIELYTGPYAAAYFEDKEAAVKPFVEAAETAQRVGLGVNAGHDLDLDNLALFAQRVSPLHEVSIGPRIDQRRPLFGPAKRCGDVPRAAQAPLTNKPWSSFTGYWETIPSMAPFRHWLCCTDCSGPLTIGRHWDCNGRPTGPSFWSTSETTGAAPHHPSHGYPDMVIDLLDTLDLLGVPRADILGHSMGGKTAMHFADRHAARCRSLIVADMAPIAYPPHHTPAV